MNGGKSPMRSERVDEKFLVGYLLGNLTEEEQVRVEDRAFSDREYLGALEGAETDLIDAYVRGELGQQDRRAFESRFLLSPSRRRKVEFAKAFAAVTAELVPAPSPAPQRVSAWQTLVDLLRASNPAFRFAGALVAVACIGGATWLVFENGSMRSRISAMEAQRLAAEARESRLQQELSRSQNSAAQTPNRPTAEPARPPLIASLALLPGLSRAETRVELLVIPVGAQLARLEVQLDDRDDFPRFRADLHTRNGREVLTLPNLRPHSGSAGRAVSIDVPATLLGAGEYELALKGLPDGQSPQDIGYYYFRVQKR
jgi:hypothetical protein